MKPHRYVPALLISAVAAVPLVTAGEILAHMGKTVAGLPPIPRRSSGSTPTPQPTPAAQSTPPPQSTPAAQSTPVPQPTPTQATHSNVSGTFTGGTYPDLFGNLWASITVKTGRIVNVHISAPMDNPTSAYINSQVVPMLKSEVLQAQSANINGISGATATSQAFYYSLVDALKKAGL